MTEDQHVDAELARIPTPAKRALAAELEAARARRVKQLAAKSKSKPKSKR